MSYFAPKPVAVDATQNEKEPPMLVLSRHRDESIMIGDDVVVTIVDIRGDKVRLGIEAPNDVPAHRQEVYEAIQRENRKANQVQPSDLRSLKENGS
jgi:carbon storage regulator